MTLRLLISLSLLLAWQAARTQTADDFFNGGAQLYISNNIPSALEKTEAGLKLYPDDAKLKKLEELLKQQQQQQNQQNQQSQQNQSRQQQQKNQQQQNKSQQKQQQNKSGQKENQQQPTEAKQGKEMTPEEAKQLLDSQKGDEQMLQLSPQGKPENQNRLIKDW